MKTLLHACLLFCSVATAVAQVQLFGFDWKNSPPAGATIVMQDGKSALKIENTNAAPLTVRLMIVTNPPVAEMLYAITGEVKYENVGGSGYLEMWNFFAPAQPGEAEGKYFSRTLGDAGEMAKISGTSDWRKFMLLFDRTGASEPPTRLEINLVLPGSGTVYLRAAKLEKPQSASWWSPRQAGLIGGIGGSVIGCFGALLGLLASKGNARNFVLTTMKTFIALGILLTLAGFVAVVSKQPYAVWYPLLLLGVILTLVISLNLPAIQRRYDELEIRRMASVDAMGS